MSPFPFLYLLISVLSLALASGCTDDLRSRELFDSGGDEVAISYTVENLCLTRNAGDEDMESNIDHAYLLFYSEEVQVGISNPLAAVRAEVSEENAAALTFKMPLNLEPSTDYQLLALANADDYTPDGFSSFADYLQTWCKTPVSERGDLQLYHAERMTAQTIETLPLSGKTLEEVPFRYTIQNGGYKVNTSLSFRRMAARIDVANMVTDGFTVEGVALCNWRNAVSVASVWQNYSNHAGAICGILSNEAADAGADNFFEMTETDYSGIQRLQAALYCLPSVCYDSYASDKESTCLIIKAKYGDDTESSYYRVNVGISGNWSEVKANTKYLVAIQSVKDRGAPTAKDAYAAEESPIVLSIVEDWDLEGSFAMDDKGNFIVLSTGRLEFEGEAVENREVKVLTSKGLSWDVVYTADDEQSADAFRATRLSDSSLAIGPTGKNTGDAALHGRFTITATTAEGGKLSVDVTVSQKAAEDVSDEPVIPDDMPFALIPESYERVKINHIEKTIEIDGFDPDCFNSFIDVPFKVYINESEGNLSSVDISTTLEWPLEGRISLDRSSQYFYCSQSFIQTGQKLVASEDGQLIQDSNLGKTSIAVAKDAFFYISVGAMGPDDPAIKREISLGNTNGKEVSYSLIIRPRPCIIDDVLLTDRDNSTLMVMDRNIQDYVNSSFGSYVGMTKEGKRRQAYNSSILKDLSSGISIPFKKLNESQRLVESKHELYFGKVYTYSTRNYISHNSTSYICRLPWLRMYAMSVEMHKTSPFYEEEEGQYSYDKWILPAEGNMETLRKNLKVSKLRMYFVSDVSVKTGNSMIPVCCYLPYQFKFIGDVGNLSAYGYYSSANGVDPNKIIIIYFDNKEGKSDTYDSVHNYSNGAFRLVRPLTAEELEAYKNEYLGYGGKPHRLTICHPDTYESEPLGWLPY